MRMYGLARGTQWGFSLWEFEVYGIPGSTNVDKDLQFVPGTFSLEQNYPNPFNPDTQIKYSIPSESNVKLEVFNINGCKVATLVNVKQSQGTYTVNFSGEGLSGGIYYYRLEAGKNRQIKRMVLLK